MKYIFTFLLLLISPMSLFAKETNEQIFWKWFQENESTIYQGENNKETVFKNLSEKLSEYQKGLALEMTVEKDGKRELIISADGIKELFPAVEALTNAAPKLERWTIVKFRPRVSSYDKSKIRFSGNEIDAAKIWINYRVQDGKFDLAVYLPDFSNEKRNEFIFGTYILLDAALGEYDVVTGIRYIDFQELPKNPESEGLKPFSELRNIFDNYKTKNYSSNIL